LVNGFVFVFVFVLYLEYNSACHPRWAYRYFFCELLALLNVIGMETVLSAGFRVE
jgi:hypothetical protein